MWGPMRGEARAGVARRRERAPRSDMRDRVRFPPGVPVISGVGWAVRECGTLRVCLEAGITRLGNLVTVT